MSGQSVLWRRLDHPGHELARLSCHDSEWHLTGTALVAYDGQPCRLEYVVVCDGEWHTQSAIVRGSIAERPIEIAVTADSARRWRMNGADAPAVAGCIDVD